MNAHAILPNSSPRRYQLTAELQEWCGAPALIGRVPSCAGFGRRERRPNPTLRRPASEKRQGTKSGEIRSVGRCRKLSYGDLSGARAGWVLARVESWRDWAP